jgi:hypothetical protein
MTQVAEIEDKNELMETDGLNSYFKGYYLTDEQEMSVLFAEEPYWLKVEAYAGAGKTSTLNAIASIAKFGLRGLYLAFNSDIVKESLDDFPLSVFCKTTHSLAYEFVIKGYPKRQRRINKPLTAKLISKEFSITKSVNGLTPLAFCGYVLEVLKNYCYSSDDGIIEEHTNSETINPVHLEDQEIIRLAAMVLAGKIWKEMNNDDSFLPITHDAYLKMWSLTNPILDYDYILFDEAQDANPLMLSILLKQKAQLIFVGDRFQQIYSWRGAVNAMQSIKTHNECQITESFRFGQPIADLASMVLNNGLGANVNIRGNPEVTSKVCTVGVPDVIICRTNSAIIDNALKYMNLGLKVHVKGGISKINKLLKCSYSLKKGKRVNTPELAAFNNWEEVVEYSKTPSGTELSTLVRLVKDYPVYHLTALLDLISKVKEEDANVVLTTVHKAKGCEWNKVLLANDFKSKGDKNFSDEEINLLYVAITRAKLELDVSECDAVSNLLNLA